MSQQLSYSVAEPQLSYQFARPDAKSASSGRAQYNNN
jgi:hypothetical protein